MNVKINRRSKIPYYQQLTQQVLLAIVTGNLTQGDHLPSIRNLAAQTDLNLHTVHKSYKELQRKGIITIKPYSAALIIVDSSKAMHFSIQQVAKGVEQIMVEANNLGINGFQLKQIFHESFRKYYADS